MSTKTTIATIEKQIDDLNQRAWEVRVNDSPKAFTLCEEAMMLARQHGYLKGIAEASRSLGFCYVRLGKNDEALPLLKESLSLFESLGDRRGQAVVNQYLGVLQRNWGDFGAALGLLFKALKLSQETGYRENEGTDHYHIGVTYKYLGEFEKSLDALFSSLRIYQEDNNRVFQSYPINIIGSIYFESGDYTRALDYYKEGLIIRQEAQDKLGEAGSLDNIGFTLFKLQDYDQAIDFCTRSLAINKTTGDKRSQANALSHLAEIYQASGSFRLAIQYGHESLEIRRAIGDKRGQAEILLFLSNIDSPNRNPETNNVAFERLTESLAIAEELKGIDLLSKIQWRLFLHYRQLGDHRNAINHLESHCSLEKELHKNAIAQKVFSLEISYKAEVSKREADSERRKNQQLVKLNEEIEVQKQKLEEAILNLKATQAQLIHSEKMASLGELTAGIAHEIQNPLNFVNNFSEVNRELLMEMNEELDNGNIEQAKMLATDVIANEEKITYHGKRAGAIVEAMLQHSRGSNGARQLTDINALTDEYMRLAYHALRAKDKSLTVTLKTEFDESLGKIDVIPGQISRVILNLVVNALYAVTEKKKRQIQDYDPTVIVATKADQKTVQITVRDNGDGIPAKVLDKIFQPFFTTKPSGVGAGLGLSLSYDIIKSHGGDLTVKTAVGEFAEFTITLPASVSV